jgi:acyl carrier protein
MMDVGAEINRLVAEELSIPLDQITDETPLSGVDSLDMLDFAFALEKRFALTDILDAESKNRFDFSDFATVGDVRRAVQRCLNGNGLCSL